VYRARPTCNTACSATPVWFVAGARFSFLIDALDEDLTVERRRRMAESDRQRFLAEALRVATENVERGGGPFGALVVKDGRIIARAANRVTQSSDPTAHAEVEAIREACRVLGTFQLEGCEIYSSSEPCPMCLGAVYWARPKAVYYANGREVARVAGFDDDHIYEEFLLPPEERRYPLVQLDIEGADEPFRLWAEKDDRVEY
jgi:guanine deaminase